MSSKISVSEYLQKTNMQKLIEEAINECYASQSDNPIAFLANYFASKGSASKITKLVGREILDSRGNPTVEVDVYLEDESKVTARASAPSGASTGSNEAVELRDSDNPKRYLGKGTLTAVSNVTNTISPALRGLDVSDLVALDEKMIELDGTDNKSKLGGNAITATSFALSYAGARLAGEELFTFLAKQYQKAVGSGDDQGTALPDKFRMPTPMVNILNGGKHAGGKLKIQEFMIVPREDIPYRERLRYAAEVYHHLGTILVRLKGKSAKNVGDEGGYAPDMETATEALSAIEEAIGAAGYELGTDIRLALDCAASEFFDAEKQLYEIQEGKFLNRDEMVDFYEKLYNDHPALISIEDGMAEDDYEGWAKLTERLGDRILIVGDDLYTTNTKFIRRGIDEKWANALLLKVNQIGTITESMRAAKMIFDANQNVVVSHRSGETETTLIADLAVALGARYIKTGSTARTDRLAKLNRLLQIEEYLTEKGQLDQQ